MRDGYIDEHYDFLYIHTAKVMLNKVPIITFIATYLCSPLSNLTLVDHIVRDIDINYFIRE